MRGYLRRIVFLHNLIVDTNIFQMIVNYRSIVYDAVSTIDDITESMHTIYVKSVLLSLFNVGGKCTFNT
jgi:hypothetical protein